MKTVILALLVLLVVSHGEALRCYCRGRQGRSCVQTCRGTNQVCGNIVKTVGYEVHHYRMCMDAIECKYLSEDASYSKCCPTDFCN